MFAIVQTGAKQYRVCPHSEIAVEKIAGQIGDKVSLEVVAAPLGTTAQTLEAEIIRQVRARKIFLFKKKRRKHYRRSGGHCQLRTWLRIADFK